MNRGAEGGAGIIGEDDSAQEQEELVPDQGTENRIWDQHTHHDAHAFEGERENLEFLIFGLYGTAS